MFILLALTADQFDLLVGLGAVTFLGVIALSGLIFLLQGIRGAVLLEQLKRRGQAVIGEVIAVTRAATPTGDTWLPVPTVRFYALNGQEVVFTSHHRGPYHVGQMLQVRYLPENPQRAELPEANIFSGPSPSLFEKLLMGLLMFPTGGFVLIQILPLFLAHL